MSVQLKQPQSISKTMVEKKPLKSALKKPKIQEVVENVSEEEPEEMDQEEEQEEMDQDSVENGSDEEQEEGEEGEEEQEEEGEEEQEDEGEEEQEQDDDPIASHSDITETEESEVSEVSPSPKKVVKKKPIKKEPKAVRELTEEEKNQQLSLQARYEWLKNQMSSKPIPVRPVAKELQAYQFLWTSTSPDLKKNHFEFQGEVFTNPTMPLRKIYELVHQGQASKSIKGWTDVEAKIKRSLKAENAEWTVLNKILPANFRSNRKSEKDESSPKKTKNSKSKKNDSPAKQPTKRTKKTADAPKKPRKRKNAASESEESPKKVIKKIKIKNQPEQEEQEEQEEQQQDDKEEKNHFPKLSTTKVMDYAQNSESICVEADIYHGSLFYTLKYSVLRNIMNFSPEQILKVIKPINQIIREGKKQETTIQEATLEELKADESATSALSKYRKPVSLSQESPVAKMEVEKSQEQENQVISEEKDSNL